MPRTRSATRLPDLGRLGARAAGRGSRTRAARPGGGPQAGSSSRTPTSTSWPWNSRLDDDAARDAAVAPVGRARSAPAARARRPRTARARARRARRRSRRAPTGRRRSRAGRAAGSRGRRSARPRRSPAACRASRGSSHWTIVPCCSTATRSAIESASSWSCVTRIAVAPAAAQHVDHLAAHARAQLDVERRERLVEQHERRARRERAGERDALALAAREVVRQPLLEAGEPDQLEQLGDARVDRRPVAPTLPARRPKATLPATRQVREERALLRHVADPAPLGRHELPRPVDDAGRRARSSPRRRARSRRSGAAASSCRCPRRRGSRSASRPRPRARRRRARPARRTTSAGRRPRPRRSVRGAHVVRLPAIRSNQRPSRSPGSIATSSSASAYGAAAP